MSEQHAPTYTYTITVTRSQLEILAAATEVLARLGIGQFRDALEELPMATNDRESWHDDMDTIGRILSEHMLHGIDGYRQSLSIGGKLVSDTARSAWDMYQVIRHRLSWERAIEHGVIDSMDASRNWTDMLGASYDEPLQISRQPLARIEPCQP